MADRIQIRRDTAANWALANPVLAIGELGFETDTLKLKIGSGSETWNSLAYVLDATAYATPADVTAAVAALVDSAPGTLDTLNELAQSLGDDANFASTVTAALSAKANTVDLATVATTGAYADVTGTPTLATVATTGAYADVTGTPTLATVATTGAYADVTGTPTLATVATTGSYNDLIDQPAGGGSFEAVASGSLSDGSTVVLNADGTVSVVAEEIPAIGPTQEVQYNNASSNYSSAAFDSNANKVIVAYQDANNSSFGSAVVGTVSGNTIDFGTPVVYISEYVLLQEVAFDTNLNKVIIKFAKGSGISWFIVGEYSGNSLTFGDPISQSLTTDYASNGMAFDPVSNKLIFVFQGLNNHGYAAVGTISGNSISFGTAAPFWTQNTTYSAKVIADTTSNKIIVLFNGGTSGDTTRRGRAIVGTVSGTSISFGTPTTFHEAKCYGYFATVDTNSNKVVISYVDSDSSPGTSYMRVGTVSGTSISFGGATSLNYQSYQAPRLAFDTTTNKVIIAAKNNIRLGIVSGSSISISTQADWQSDVFDANALIFDNNANKAVIIYTPSTSGNAVVYRTAQGEPETNLTAENYAGIADAAYADAATATIQTAGSVDDAQSGLTPGQAYYVQANGTLGLTPSTPNVFAGTAVSATSLLIGKEAPASTVAYADVTGTPDLSSYASTTYVDTAVSNLVDTAPDALNTLNELAAALNDDADFAGTVTTSLAAKANTADLATVATTGSYNDLIDQPAGGGSFEAVASGSLSDGSTVVLNADGTVSVVGEVETPGSLGTDYPSAPDGSGNDKQITMYDSTSGKTVIVAHGGSPSYIGTISLTTFNANGSSSYTPISFPAGFDNGSYRYTAMISIGNGKFVLSHYSSANSDYRAVVGTISGDTITWGTSYVVASGIVDYVGLTYYAAEDKVILLGSGNFRVGTVSGTDITFGSPTATPSSSNGTLAYFPNRSKAVYIYSSNGATSILFKTFTLDSSGNITLGSTVLSSVIGMTLNASQSNGASFYHTGLNKFVFIGFNDSNNSIFSVVVDIDETGQLVVYTPKAIHSGRPRPSHIGAAYDPNINTYVVYWMSNNGDNGPVDVLHIKEATIDSNTYNITTGSLIVSLSDIDQGISRGLYIPEIQKTLMLFGTGAGRRAAVWTFTQQLTNLTAENYSGIADAAYADAATATIQTAGSVDDAQSGLTPGQAYYVQGDGTLGLNPDTPSVFAGTAVSATSLLIGKEAPAATVAYADVTGTPDLSSYASTTYVDTAVSNLVDTAPDALNTLNELAAALNDDADFAGTVTTSLAAKANTADLATVATSGSYNDLTDQPAGGGSFEAVASGSLSDGSTVVLNADGTVSVVNEDVVPSSTSSLGTYTVSNAGNKIYSFGYDSINNLILFAAFDGSSIECSAGSISDGIITFGPTSTVPSWSGWDRGGLFVFFDSASEKFVLVGLRIDSSPYAPYGVAITVDPATKGLTFGTNVQLMSGSGNQLSIAQNPTTGDIVGFTANSSNSSYGTAFLFSVVEGTVVKHEEVVANSVNPSNHWMSYDPVLDKFIISNDYITHRFISVSENSMTFSTPTVTNQPNSLHFVNSAYNIKNNNHVISYLDTNDNYNLYAVCAIVTPSTIVYGTPLLLSTDTARQGYLAATTAIYDPISEKMVVFGSGSTNAKAYRLDINNAGTISSSTAFTFTGSGSPSFTRPAYDSTTQKIILATSVSTTITLNSFTTGGNVSTNLTAENYAGIADAAYADAATATIQTAGSVDDAQSGLTPGQAYYVQANGTLGLAPGTPRVFAGVATSATKLLIGKEGPAVDLSSYASTSYVDTAVSNLVDTAPEALNTLNELAAALNDDANFAGTVTTSLAAKANTADLATVATSGSYNDLSDQPVIAGGGSFEAVASGSLSDGSTVVLNADGTVAAVAQEVTTSLLQTLNNPNAYGTSANDFFGISVATSGNYAIVGAHQEDDAGGTGSGKAYIFNVTTGALLYTLNNPNAYGTSANDYFGYEVAISGNYAIVSAWGEDAPGSGFDGLDSGKAYIYNVTTGALLHTLNNPNPYGTTQEDYFGYKVSISGDYAIISAYREDDANGFSSGKAYIYNVTTGALVHTLANPNAYGTATADEFGNSVGISGNYAIVGAKNEYDGGGLYSGKAYIFDVTTGALVHTLNNPNPYGTSESDYFGSSVGISGNYAIVGAQYEDDAGGTSSGKAYIFDVPTGALLHTLNNPNAYDTSLNDNFGNSVGISGNYAIVGAYNEDDAGGSNSGKAYIFDVASGALVHTYDNPNPYGTSENDYFGQPVAISGNYAIVSSYREADAGGTISGKAYIYSLPTTTTNLTAENYAGIANASYADAATATIQTAGSVDDAQSGLTPGQAYYVQANGTLGLAPGTPSVFAGTAVSSTKLLIGKEAPAATVAYADITGTPTLATVATTGAYSDLTGTPTGLATETYVDTAVSNLVDTAPEALNTLNELAAALNDDADFAGTVTTSLSTKLGTDSVIDGGTV